MDRDVAVQHCVFEALVDKAILNIKFPCTYFIEWKAPNGKYSVQGKKRPSAIDNQVSFQQTLIFEQDLLLDNHTKKFLKKDTLLNINLISRSRKDQIKLVGRINIDLAEIGNNKGYDDLSVHSLSYCSVDGKIVFRATLKSREASNMSPEDIDRSSYNEYLSFYSTQNKDLCSNGIGQHRSLESRLISKQITIDKNIRNTQPQATNKLENGQRQNRVQMAMQQRRVRQHNSPSQSQSFRGSTSFRNTIKGIAKPRLDEQRQNETFTDSTIPKNDWYRPRQEWPEYREHVNIPDKREITDNNIKEQMGKNRQKIQELQNRIKDLNNNLQISKRQVERTEKDNREKEQMINELKSDRPINGQAQEQHNYKSIQNQLRQQIASISQSYKSLQRETQELKKLWIEKKEHYDQKVKYLEDIRREKDIKIEELNSKAEAAAKYRYQWELMKELGDQKDNKIKQAQKQLIKLSSQLEEIKNNKVGQENCRLKMECSQAEKNLKEMTQKCVQWQEQVGKFKENYIKISTAYEIQSKNYQSNKIKYGNLESQYFEMQKENIELKNTVSSLRQQQQLIQTELKYSQQNIKSLSSQLDKLTCQKEQLEEKKNISLQEIKSLRLMVDKMTMEKQVRASQSAQELKRMETTFMNALQQKDNQFASQKKDLELALRQQKESIKLSEMKHKEEMDKIKENEAKLRIQLDNVNSIIARKQVTIEKLQETIVDKQQIIRLERQQLQNLRQSHQQLSISLAKTNQKQQQLKITIEVLEQQSQKIIELLENKEQVEKQIQDLKNQFQSQLQEVESCKRKAAQAQQQAEQLNSQHQLILGQLDSKNEQIKVKDDEILRLRQQIQLSLLEIQEMKESANQTEQLRAVVQDINERYEEHLGLEERYAEQITSLRQQLSSQKCHSQETLREMQKCLKQIQDQNEQLQHRITELEEEKNNYEQIVNDSSQSMVEARGRCDDAEIKIQEMEEQIIQLSASLQKKQLQLLEKTDLIQGMSKQLQGKEQTIIRLEELLQESQTHTYSFQNMENKIKKLIQDKLQSETSLQQRIKYLEHELDSTKNAEIHHTKENSQNIMIYKNHHLSQQQKQLQEMLLESDRKNQVLEIKIQDLMFELQDLKKYQSEPQQIVYSSFPEFQQQQMTKIIEEQKQQIERLQTQAKGRIQAEKSVSTLQKKIADLQEHIIKLEQNFKGQIEKIVGQQYMTASLEVIRQEGSEQDLNRSQHSLLNSLSRVKSSFEVGQASELRDKLNTLQQERDKLEEEYCSIEEQKFNLLSTINQKDILIEDLQQCRILLNQQISRLVQINGELEFKIKGLQSQIETLKNHLAFGSNILYSQEGGMTRSEPILAEQSKILINKEIEIQNLKAEIHKKKGRQDQLLWNIKDLQMQLQIVTDNLNILNASGMNSLLNSCHRIQEGAEKDKKTELAKEEGYDKEKLLLSLKKNEQLKQTAHNIIRAFKERERDWKQQQITINEFRKERSQAQTKISQNQSSEGLLRHFQGIKLYIMKQECQAAKDQNEKNIIKSVIVLEQALKEAKLLWEQ